MRACWAAASSQSDIAVTSVNCLPYPGTCAGNQVRSTAAVDPLCAAAVTATMNCHGARGTMLLATHAAISDIRHVRSLTGLWPLRSNLQCVHGRWSECKPCQSSVPATFRRQVRSITSPWALAQACAHLFRRRRRQPGSTPPWMATPGWTSPAWSCLGLHSSSARTLSCSPHTCSSSWIHQATVTTSEWLVCPRLRCRQGPLATLSCSCCVAAAHACKFGAAAVQFWQNSRAEAVLGGRHPAAEVTLLARRRCNHSLHDKHFACDAIAEAQPCVKAC